MGGGVDLKIIKSLSVSHKKINGKEKEKRLPLCPEVGYAENSCAIFF